MKKKRRRLRKSVFITLFVIFSSLFLYSSYRIIDWKINNRNNSRINKTLHKYVTTDSNEKFKINFDKLKELNSDTIAYIKVNNTNIDYVVVQTNDNDYYLTHNFEKKNNKSGWIFMDYNNKLDGEDKNIIIYGHNTIDKSMFGSLKSVLEKEWYENENNRKIIFATTNGVYEYEVFSVYKIDNEEYYITTNFTTSKGYQKFLNTIKKRSKYNFNVELNENDHILTLSTCSNNGNKRVVLHAKRLDRVVE